MLSGNERKKTTKAERKKQKRNNIIMKKTLLPSPKNIQFRIDESAEIVLFTGDIENKGLTQFLRFKLSGQQDFATYGYPAKIPAGQTSFHFEIPLVALLDEDEVTIQVFNERGQISHPFVCRFVKFEQGAVRTIYRNTTDKSRKKI